MGLGIVFEEFMQIWADNDRHGPVARSKICKYETKQNRVNELRNYSLKW